MAEVFTWRAVNEGRGKVSFRVTETKFGDGYAQTSPDGLNPVSRTWPLTFAGTADEIGEITAFLEAHVGRSFLWKPPLSAQRLFQCRGYEPRDEGGQFYTISTTFVESHQP
jgi:phage-related protein